MGQRIFKIVEVLAVLDLDRHLARQARQLIRARIRHYDDRQLAFSSRHAAVVLENESSFAAVQFARHCLDRDVTRRALNPRARGQHLALARAFKISLPPLVDCHSS